MNSSMSNNCLLIFISTLALLLMATASSPMPEDEQPERAFESRADEDSDMSVPWDALNSAALRKLLLQIDADDRMNMGARVGRSWPQAEPRGWGLRTMDGRLARQWRADKRQVRFRQCYFNPISCFRKNNLLNNASTNIEFKELARMPNSRSMNSPSMNKMLPKFLPLSR